MTDETTTDAAMTRQEIERAAVAREVRACAQHAARIHDEIADEAAAWLRDTMPRAGELERFGRGFAEPVAGVLTFQGGPEKGVKARCYLSASGVEVVALKPKKVTKAGGGVEVGATVLKVAAHVPVGRVLGFTPAGA